MFWKDFNPLSSYARRLFIIHKHDATSPCYTCQVSRGFYVVIKTCHGVTFWRGEAREDKIFVRMIPDQTQQHFTRHQHNTAACDPVSLSTLSHVTWVWPQGWVCPHSILQRCFQSPASIRIVSTFQDTVITLSEYWRGIVRNWLGLELLVFKSHVFWARKFIMTQILGV